MMQYLQDFDLEARSGEEVAYLSNLIIQPTIQNELIQLQREDPLIYEIKRGLEANEVVEDYSLGTDGEVRYKGRLMLPMTNNELKNQILQEAHHSKFTIHRG